MQKKILFSALLIVLIILPYGDVMAQCAMCQAVLESNMQAGGSGVGAGINSGILYIMFIPYILTAVIGVIMYRHFKKTQADKA